jgi:ADP-ribosylglycohydrolase
LKHPHFLQNPHAVAEEIWIQGNKQVAANGAVMRTSVLGIWQYQDLNAVRQNTENVAKITHFDPRCIGSCVALTTTIARILQGETDIDKLYDCAEAEAAPYDVRILPYLQDARKQSITYFDLEEKTSIGYTLKALACAFWALRQDNFQDAISAIIHEGGDADTNGAVAGALLGAKLGYDSLPTPWLYGLVKRTELEQKADKLYEFFKNIAIND